MNNNDNTLVRNFSIIAHIDHGKSTLADRFIQACGGLEERESREALLLDFAKLAKELGIDFYEPRIRSSRD